MNGSAYAVSYNRPITTRDASAPGFIGEYGTSNDMVFSAEFPTIYWLEENGYDVSYISGNNSLQHPTTPCCSTTKSIWMAVTTNIGPTNSTTTSWLPAMPAST